MRYPLNVMGWSDVAKKFIGRKKKVGRFKVTYFLGVFVFLA